MCPPLLKDFSFRETLERTDFPEPPVLGIFTSGTSAPAPRLVLYSRANLEASLSAILSVFDESRIDAIFGYPQPFHTFGLTLAYLHALVRGKKLIAPAGRYAASFHDAWWEASRAHPGLLTLGTPTHFQDLRRYARETRGGERPATTYSAIVGGAPCTRALWNALRSELGIAEPSIGYGCTEAAPGLTHLPPGVEPEFDGEVGNVLPEVLLALKPGTGLTFDGPNRCLAILSADSNGAHVEFPKEVHVKDHLEWTRDGRLRFLGRYDLQMNRGGVKFSLERIEAFVRTYSGQEVLAIAVPDERLGEDLGLLVQGPLSSGWKSALATALHAEFGAHFNAERFRTIPNLPLNASAKLDRHAARAELGFG